MSDYICASCFHLGNRIASLRVRNTALKAQFQAMEKRAKLAEAERDKWRDAAIKAATALERAEERDQERQHKLRIFLRNK